MRGQRDHLAGGQDLVNGAGEWLVGGVDDTDLVTGTGEVLGELTADQASTKDRHMPHVFVEATAEAPVGL